MNGLEDVFNMKKVVATKDLYQNIKGVGKIKELTKGKVYESYANKSLPDSTSNFKLHIAIINDLNEFKIYVKRNMFKSISKSRNDKLTQIGL
jgi:uncharacterized protein (DUF39 family)